MFLTTYAALLSHQIEGLFMEINFKMPIVLSIIIGILGLGLVIMPTSVSASTNYSGTMSVSDTSHKPVTWTLKEGLLTLSGGVMGAPNTDLQQNGQLLMSLVNSTDIKPAGTTLTIQDLAPQIETVKLTAPIWDGTPNDLANPTYEGADLDYLFANLTAVTHFVGLDYLQTANVATREGYYRGMAYMFANDTSLVTFTSPKFAVTATTSPRDMSDMLSGDSALLSADLSQLDTHNVSSIYQLFINDTSIRTINLANMASYDAKTTNLFLGDQHLQNLTLSPKVHLTTSQYLLLTVGLRPDMTPTDQSTFTSQQWQAVGNGQVNFVNNDPTQSYLNYNPLGETYSSSVDEKSLVYHYTNDNANIPGNETYVWKPDKPIIAPAFPTTAVNPVTPPTINLAPYYVIATHKIGFYRTPNFTAGSRSHWFVKKPQMKQPTFTIMGTATSVNGNPRYRVRDTNRGSMTYGKKGYITAKPAYVTATYDQVAPKAVTVIARNGINGYNNAPLDHKQVSYPQGTILNVKAVVTSGHVTRFRLTNGHYITANKRLITTGKVTIPSQVRVKSGMNRYTNANLTTRNHHYIGKHHQTLKITGYDYSHGISTSVSGHLRYRVTGGYITSNPKLVTRLN